jgi:superfamily I DNA/RNA helicase
MVELNPSQVAALESNAKDIVITAPAGSGKTTVLIEAVIKYRHEHPNENIDVITYTRAATAELHDRLAEQNILDVNISTIHVWSRERLKEMGVLYNFTVKVLEQDEIMIILRQILSEYMGCKVKPEILYSYVTGNKKMDVSAGYAKALEALDNRYIAYKRRNNLYDFTDYPLYLLTVLKKYNEKITSTDALFVDELQDVDHEQRELFERVMARKKFYIGDAWQAIYFFRGADSEIFDSLNDFTKYRLSVNYRSYQEIMDYADTFYLDLRKEMVTHGVNSLVVSIVRDRKPSDTVCYRGKGGIVYLTIYNGRTFTVQPRCDSMDEMLGQPDNEIDTFDAGCDMLSGNYFILCRTNKQVKAIQDLGFQNVSTIHQAKGLEYDNVIMIDINVQNYEDLNIAYVAATRARNKLMVISFDNLYRLLLLYKNEKLAK